MLKTFVSVKTLVSDRGNRIASVAQHRARSCRRQRKAQDVGRGLRRAYWPCGAWIMFVSVCTERRFTGWDSSSLVVTLANAGEAEAQVRVRVVRVVVVPVRNRRVVGVVVPRAAAFNAAVFFM